MEAGDKCRAAHDGYLIALKETTKKDCNQQDEDGITPTACAAHMGNLESLRLLVGRGGDPEKCDYYGNTSLHCAAARGHMSCVSFLVSFGVNIWALDNEFHSAKDLAAINNKQDVLKYLDLEEARREKVDVKKAKKLQETAIKDAEKRLREIDKIQRKADKKRQEEEEQLEREREKLCNLENVRQNTKKKNLFYTISKNPLAVVAGSKNEPRANNFNSPKFSELTQNTSNSDSNKLTLSNLQKKILKKKIKDENDSENHFKVRETENGKQSVRKLSGLQRDSEILFVPNGSLNSTTSEPITSGKRGRLSEVFEKNKSEDDRFSFSPSSTTVLKEDHSSIKLGSIFDRPGFGSVTFRNSLQSTFITLHNNMNEASSRLSQKLSDDAIDTPFDNRGPHQNSLPAPLEEKDDTEEPSPVYRFLLANGLGNYMPQFTREDIDLEALMLLTDQDLEALKLPMGPRKKLMKALNERRLVLTDPGEVTDVHL